MTSACLWQDGAPARTRPALEQDRTVDVCIVGGGFTGLWTAYYLTRADPSLSVLVVESEHVGFGASGRNGGWVSALWPVSPEVIAARHGEAAARDQLAALRETVDEVGAVAAAEGIDAGFVKGGTLSLARNQAQRRRAQDEAQAGAAWGTGTRWLEADQARERVRASDVLGATFNPNCARVHPYRLVRGLAEAVTRQGADIVEGTPVSAVGGGVVRTAAGPTVHARHVIRATEAWTARMPGLRRRIAPVYSLMVATEPLPAERWDEIGLAAREVFSDHRHVIIYGQRTVDDRLAFGGRGAPYHFGSGIRPQFDTDERVFAMLRATLLEMFPAIGTARFTHAWGGPLGIARDWHPGVGYDPVSGVGWAGGYVGDGVAATNLAGRTLADLVTGRRTALTRLPWVQHAGPAWEVEPLRWLGANAGLQLASWADAEERLTGRPARLGSVLSALTSH